MTRSMRSLCRLRPRAEVRMVATMKPLMTANSEATTIMPTDQTRASPQVRGGNGPYPRPVTRDLVAP